MNPVLIIDEWRNGYGDRYRLVRKGGVQRLEVEPRGLSGWHKANGATALSSGINPYMALFMRLSRICEDRNREQTGHDWIREEP